MIPPYSNNNQQMPYQGEVTLNIHRKGAYVAMAMPYRVIIDGVEYGKIKNGGRQTYILPAGQHNLRFDMWGNSLNLNKIYCDAFIDTSLCRQGVINVTVQTKANFIGILTSGFGKPVGELHATVQYF